MSLPTSRSAKKTVDHGAVRPSHPYVAPSRLRQIKSESDENARLRPGHNPPPITPPNSAFRGVPGWLVKTGLSSWLLIGVVAVVGGVILGTFQITPVFIALFIALVFASILTPVVNLLDRFMVRWLAVIISLLGAFAVFGGMLTFVITSVAGQWNSLFSQLGNGIDKIAAFVDTTPFQVSVSSDQIYDWFNSLIQMGQSYVTNNWQSLAGNFLSNAGSIAVGFTIFALAIFMTIFFLHSGANMWRWFLNLLPTKVRAKTNRAAQAGWGSFSGYARGTMIIASTDGAMAWLFLQLIGVPLAPALGVLVMIGAFIPMVGAPAAMLLAMIVALAVDGIWKAALVGIGIALIGQLEGHVLQPLIMGKQVSLHPVVVGVGVVTGTLLGGLLGAMIAIPILGVTWAVFTALYHRDPPIEGDLPGNSVIHNRGKHKLNLRSIAPSFLRNKLQP